VILCLGGGQVRGQNKWGKENSWSGPDKGTGEGHYSGQDGEEKKSTG